MSRPRLIWHPFAGPRPEPMDPSHVPPRLGGSPRGDALTMAVGAGAMAASGALPPLVWAGAALAAAGLARLAGRRWLDRRLRRAAPRLDPEAAALARAFGWPVAAVRPGRDAAGTALDPGMRGARARLSALLSPGVARPHPPDPAALLWGRTPSGRSLWLGLDRAPAHDPPGGGRWPGLRAALWPGPPELRLVVAMPLGRDLRARVLIGTSAPGGDWTPVPGATAARPVLALPGSDPATLTAAVGAETRAALDRLAQSGTGLAALIDRDLVAVAIEARVAPGALPRWLVETLTRIEALAAALA